MDKQVTADELTEADVKWFGLKSSNSSNPGARAEEPRAPETEDDARDDTDRSCRIPFKPHDLYYDMSGERILVVFNHKMYEKTVYFQWKRPSERNGTEEDVKSLERTFTKLGFKSTVHHNLRHVDIIQEIREVCRKDHRGTSCVVIAVMTHGEEDNSILAADRPYHLRDVINLLQNSPGLVGKPKLVFVQACRGDGMDDGKRVQIDGHASIVLPTHADTLIMLATAEKHYAYRDSNGSWLMQALCQVLDERHEQLDLLQMITLVNQIIAYKASYTLSEKTNNKKMMPETKFTLTKLVKF